MAARATAQDKATTETVADNAEVAIPRVDFDDLALSEISSFDDALALLAADGTVIEHASDVIGNGFTILKDKSLLCGVELLFLGWSFNAGDNGDFVSCYVVARMPGSKVPSKFIVNDGSTGLYKDLFNYTKKTGRIKGLHVKNGLTRSDYTYVDKETGEQRPATTFYLDTSA